MTLCIVSGRLGHRGRHGCFAWQARQLVTLCSLWSPWTPLTPQLLCVAGSVVSGRLGRCGCRACFAWQARHLVTLRARHLVTLCSLWSPWMQWTPRPLCVAGAAAKVPSPHQDPKDTGFQGSRINSDGFIKFQGSRFQGLSLQGAMVPVLNDK